jgi:hypothetical protein
MSDHHDLESPPESARVREALELAREEEVEWGEGRRARSWDEVARELGLQEELEEEVRRKELWAIAVAALVLAGAAVLSRGQAPAEAPAVEATRVAREAPRDERAADAPEEQVVEAPARDLALLAHRVDGMGEPLFASADARWTYDASGTMTLERGRVLIEYVPTPTPSAFTVVTGDARVRVLGTVFSVERREGRTRVAVFEGSVRVEHGEGSHMLERDQAWRTGDDALSSARAEELEEVTHHVDMEAHRAQIARVHAERDAMAREAEREVRRAPEPAKPSVRARIERAEAWMASGEYAMARDALESAAREVPERSARARQIELDLARIATRHLRDDARAVTHLRRVARRWPDHPAAALARAQLCALDACEEGE